MTQSCLFLIEHKVSLEETLTQRFTHVNNSRIRVAHYTFQLRECRVQSTEEKPSEEPNRISATTNLAPKKDPHGVQVTPARTHDGRMELGQRVRDIRRRLGKTLQEVGEGAGLSKSTLSKIENGTLSVSFDNLMKLAGALSIEVSALFAGDSPPPAPAASNGRRSVARKGTGEIYETLQYRYEMLCNDLNPKRMFPIVATLRAHSVASAKELIRHPGEEFVFVLEGQVQVHSEFYSPLVLEAGEGIYFDSTMGHALVSAGNTDARILWMATNALHAGDAPPAKPIDAPKKAFKQSR